MRQSDVAGNTSGNSAMLSFILDNTSPSGPALALASDTGSSSSDKVTSAGTVNVSGLEPGASWEYSLNGTTWTAGTGSSFVVSGDGAKTVSVRQTDVAGNIGSASTLGFTLDTTVPTAPSLSLAADTGSSAADGVTKTGTVNVTGVEAGATWQYSLDGTTWTAGTGTSFAVSGDGSKTVSVRQTDAAGNVSGASSTLSFTLDTTAPAALTQALSADTGSSSSDGVTRIGVINVSGLEAGATWQYTLDGTTWLAGTGTSFSVSGDGAKSVQVRQIDQAGNTGPASTTLSFTLDTAAGVPTLALASDTGSSATDKTTSSGTVNVSGLEAGASWEYSLDGTTWSPGSGSTLALAGDGTRNLIVRQTDAAGNVSSNSSTLTYTLDTAAPVAPAFALSADTGSSATDKITSTGLVNVTGLEGGSTTWQYSTNNGTSWTAGTGTSFTLTTQGANQVIVRQTDLAGNVTTSAMQTITFDSTAPVAPGFALTGDTGSSATDKTTSNGLVDVTGIEAGATWEYSVNNGSTWMAGTGTSFTLTAQGANQVLVRQTDVAGNVTTSAMQTITLDTTAPVAPGVALASDTGSSATDKITNNGLVNVTGLEGGTTTWQYSTNSGTTWTAGTGTSFTLTTQGVNQVMVRQTDLAGNIAIGALQTITLDTTAPAAPGFTLASDTGSSATDKTTSNGLVNVTGLEAGATWEYSVNNGSTWTAGTATSFTLTTQGANQVLVRQTDVAGNVTTSAVQAITLDTAAPVVPSFALASNTGSSSTDKTTNNGLINVTGLEGGTTTWQYSVNNGSTWTAGTGTSFTLGTQGANQVMVRQTDLAGNTTTSTMQTITLDTGAPTAPSFALSSDTGSSATDKTTSNGLVNVTGLEAGATWEYSVNNGSTWTAGTATSFTLTTQGANQVLVRQTDLAGNTTTSTMQTITLDTSAPVAPGFALSADTGSSATDKTTSNGLVNVTGIEAGATWEYSVNNGSTWAAGTGSSFTLGTQGANQVMVRQTDLAGNVSSSSAMQTITLDTVAPATPSFALSSDTGSSATDKITNNGLINVTGLVGGTTTWEYSVNNGSSWTAGTGTSFTLTAQGVNQVMVRQTDLAGNVATSAMQSITFDNVAPTLTITSNGTATTTTGTITFTFSETVTGFATGDVTLGSPSSGSVTKGTFAGTGASYTLGFTKTVAGVTFTATIVASAYTDTAGNTRTTSQSQTGLKPAGFPINFGLETLSDEGLSYVRVMALDLPADWKLGGGGIRLDDGTWLIRADELARVTVETPSSFLGAAVVQLAVVSTYADGHEAITMIANNIEAYAPGNPIFAWAGDDNLTGSSGADTFVLADPIGSDVIYAFDTAKDVVDLVAFQGFNSFADVLAHLVDDATGSAVLTLAAGKTIRFDGVHAADLKSGNFLFNVEAHVENSGVIEIRDGAMLPLAGAIHNTGTIELLGSDYGAHLQIIQQGTTLTGHGHLVLSDDDDNVVFGTAAGVTLTNVDNTISGAGRLGGVGLSIVNAGTIVADGTHALVIDGNGRAFVNTGLAEATGTGGLRVAGAIDNEGTVWANGSSVSVQGEASGDGRYLVTGHGIIQFSSSASGRIEIAGDATATLHLSAHGFDGAISGFNGDDRIVVDGDWAGAALNVVTTSAGALLTIGAGSRAETLALSGIYDAEGFTLTDAGDHLVLTYAARTLAQADHVLG